MPRLPFRVGVIKAGDVRPGDVLWSDTQGRLLVMMVEHLPTEQVRYGKGTGRMIESVRLTVLQQKLGSMPHQLGNYPLNAELQLVRRKRRDANSD